MRRFLKIFLTVVVLAGAFVAYLVYQPGVAQKSSTYTPPTVQALQSNSGNLIVGQGENAWVRQFDDEGHLSSRFRAAKWDPMGNGLLKVTRPEAELYVRGKDNGRAKITIQGTDGEVVMEGLPEASAADAPLDPKGMGSAAGPTQPPSSGRLNGVVICVYETDTAAVPSVTLRTNNIVFDNETFRISTETYTGADGAPVASDQVAVSVEGPDFDFYGRGLTVRWNDVDERLDLLRIAHGDRIVIKNPGAMSGSLFGEKGEAKSPKQPTDAAAAAAARDGRRGLWMPLEEMLVSADPSAAGAAIGADQAAAPDQAAAKGKGRRKKQSAEGGAPRPARRKEQPPYRAAFAEQVRVLEGEEPRAKADLMHVDFLLGGAGDGTKPKRAATRPAPATNPTTAPAAAPPEVAAAASSDTSASTQPAAESDAAAVSGTQPTTSPTTGPAAVAVTAPATAPATGPASQPITIYWVGELNVTPLDPASVQYPPAPGEAGIELIGTASPVELTRENTVVRCARFAYRTDGTLALDKSEAFPAVTVTHRPADDEAAAADAAAAGPADETTVTTESVLYSFPDRVATLRGNSRVTAPIQSKRDAESGTVDAAWTNVATFNLVGERQDELWVQRAEFTGDVDVNGPQGRVKAQQLALLFDAPSPGQRKPKRAKGDAAREAARAAAATQPFGEIRQPNLRRIIATTDVSCELADAREGQRSVACQRLELETAKSDDGKLYPKVIDAAGSVHARDPGQDLRSEHVVLTLKPAPPRAEDAGEAAADEEAFFKAPSDAAVATVALDSLLATGGVRVTSKDGAVATGQRLHVTTSAEGDPHVELSGEPAEVADAKNGTLTGRTIVVDPRTGVAHIPGEGSLRTVQRTEQEAAQGKPGRPIEVTWDEGADLLSGDNRVDVAGSVMLRVTEADGTVRTVSAGKVSVELVEKTGAAAGPRAEAARDSKEAPGVGKEAVAGSLKMDVFKGREIGVVTFRQDAVVNSQRVAADGTVVQRFHLKAPVITYDVASQHLAVPGPGRMLVENHEDPAAKKAGPKDGQPEQAKANRKAARADDPAALATGNGATAFEWTTGLEFEEAAGKATMEGGVVVTHQPDDAGEPPVRLDANELVARFATADKPASGGKAGAPPAAAAPEGPKFQIKSVSAVGNIVITRDGAELTAGRIDYDPATQWVIARGDERNPAAFSDPNGTQSTTARELWLNTKTWNVTIKGANVRVGGVSR